MATLSQQKKFAFHVGKEGLMTITPLGAGCEVGRSCIVVEYQGRSVMFDCGIHPAHSGIGALPVFDAVDISSVDLCLVTHFHLDHCGALPYFISKTSFKGKVLMTEPTKAIAKLLWSDYAAMTKFITSNAREALSLEYMDNAENMLFNVEDIDATLSVCETINFRQTRHFKNLGLSVTCYSAGHVLGACMFCVDMAGVRVLYTGDFSREHDRHVPLADIPSSTVDVLICESTYGIRVHEPRAQRELRLLNSVDEILKKKGKCLLPVFALGRVQEILLIFEEYWKAHPDYHSIPIWYISPLSSRSLTVFESFISMCGTHVKQLADCGDNPFEFQYIKTAHRVDELRDAVYKPGPCVVLAAPGMLQSGTSRALFELWCKDKRNGVILTGYTLKGTLADELKKCPPSLQLSTDGPETPIACSFEIISFSAHSDFNQTYDFIERLKTKIVVLVHGERGEAHRLREKLSELCPNLAIFAPEILQRVDLRFPARRNALCVGSICDEIDDSEGVYAAALFNESTKVPPTLVTLKDLPSHTPTTRLVHSISLYYPYQTLEPLHNRVSGLFETVDFKTPNSFRVENFIEVHLCCNQTIKIAWESNPLSDLVADSVAFATIDVTKNHSDTDDNDTNLKSMNSMETTQPPTEASVESDVQEKEELMFRNTVLIALEDIYGCAKIDNDNNCIEVRVPILTKNASYATVFIDFNDRKVNGDNQKATDSIQRLLRRIESSVLPLPSPLCFHYVK